LKTLPSRRAKAVLETIASLRDYAKLIGIELNIDTKFLRKFLPPMRIEEITESILEYEIQEGKGKDIVSQAIEQIQEAFKHDSKFKIPILISFFTGLRSTEIKHMMDRWNSLRKIEIVDGVILVELNYDRKVKKAYITLIPKRLVELINDWVKENRLSNNWKDHVRHRLGIRLGLFRKSFQAITTQHLDKAERELLLGHLKSIQVKHYIKHIKSIASRYLEAYKNYLHILDSLNPN
jgi:integrase